MNHSTPSAMRTEPAPPTPETANAELKPSRRHDRGARLRVMPDLPDQVIPFRPRCAAAAPPPRGGGGRESGRSSRDIDSDAESFCPKGARDVVRLVRWLRRELATGSPGPSAWIEGETWFTAQLGRIAETALEVITTDGSPDAIDRLRYLRKKRRRENREKSPLGNWRELQEIPGTPGNVIAFPSTFESRERWLAHRGACGTRERPAQRPPMERLPEAVQDALRVIQAASVTDAARIGMTAVEALADWAGCTADKQPARILARLEKIAKNGGENE